MATMRGWGWRGQDRERTPAYKLTCWFSVELRPHARCDGRCCASNKRTCMQMSPGSKASRVPVQAGAGYCGERQRRSPRGGLAKGMPMKWRTPLLALPRSDMLSESVTKVSSPCGRKASMTMPTWGMKHKRHAVVRGSFGAVLPCTLAETHSNPGNPRRTK